MTAGVPLRVVIAGGGVAGLEATLALRALAADRVSVTILAPEAQPEIRGLLLTGGQPRFLTARMVGGRGFESRITDAPTWSPPTKIAAKYLAPYLEMLDARREPVAGL